MKKLVETEWAGGFKAGEKVQHGPRSAHVIAVPSIAVEPGKIPIMYDNEGGCYINVAPAELLQN